MPDKNSLCVNVLVLVMDGRDIVAQAGRVADPVILVFRSPSLSVVPEDADWLALAGGVLLIRRRRRGLAAL